MIVLFFLILLFIILIINLNLNKSLNKNKEKFITAEGKSFSYFYDPYPRCSPKNNCFPGYYFRSQLYQNMCEPDNINLLREKRNVIDTCVRTLDSNIIN